MYVKCVCVCVCVYILSICDVTNFHKPNWGEWGGDGMCMWREAGGWVAQKSSVEIAFWYTSCTEIKIIIRFYFIVCERGLSAWPLFETHCYYYFIPFCYTGENSNTQCCAEDHFSENERARKRERAQYSMKCMEGRMKMGAKKLWMIYRQYS